METLDTKKAEAKNYAKIVDLLKVKPVLYQVCKYEIDPATGKPRKFCWIEEPKMALTLR